jgi:hypothetical protein
VSKPKLQKFRGNDRDTMDIKTWCLQISRLDHVQKFGHESTVIIVMEALREQALSWALLLQDEKPESAASWKLLQPLLLERCERDVLCRPTHRGRRHLAVGFTLLFEKNNNPTKNNNPCCGRHSDTRRGPRPVRSGLTMHGNQRIGARDLGQRLHDRRARPSGRHDRQHDQ